MRLIADATTHMPSTCLIRTRPATLHETAGTSPSASARAQDLLCRDVQNSIQFLVTRDNDPNTASTPASASRSNRRSFRDVLDARTSHMLAAEQQQTSADTCSASCVGTSALQHTCIAGTHALQHTLLDRCDVVLWTCTHTCKSGDGMDTVL